MPRQLRWYFFRIPITLLGLGRHYWESLNCLGISRNAWFPQFPETYSSNKSLFSTIKLKTNRTESDIGFSNLYLVKQICILNCNRFHYQEKKEGNVETGKNDGEPLPVEKRSQDMACDDTYIRSISQTFLWRRYYQKLHHFTTESNFSEL